MKACHWSIRVPLLETTRGRSFYFWPCHPIPLLMGVTLMPTIHSLTRYFSGKKTWDHARENCSVKGAILSRSEDIVGGVFRGRLSLGAIPLTLYPWGRTQGEKIGKPHAHSVDNVNLLQWMQKAKADHASKMSAKL